MGFEIRKGMPRIKQASLNANQKLSKTLAAAGCVQSRFTPSTWKQKNHDVGFTLVEDDLGMKHMSKQSITQLLDTLRFFHTIATDWTGSNYLRNSHQ